jgi:hypothetical protein
VECVAGSTRPDRLRPDGFRGRRVLRLIRTDARLAMAVTAVASHPAVAFQAAAPARGNAGTIGTGPAHLTVVRACRLHSAASNSSLRIRAGGRARARDRVAVAASARDAAGHGSRSGGSDGGLGSPVPGAFQREGQPLQERRVGDSPGTTADGLLARGAGRLGMGQGCEAEEEENRKQARTMDFHKTSIAG